MSRKKELEDAIGRVVEAWGTRWTIVARDGSSGDGVVLVPEGEKPRLDNIRRERIALFLPQLQKPKPTKGRPARGSREWRRAHRTGSG